MKYMKTIYQIKGIKYMTPLANGDRALQNLYKDSMQKVLKPPKKSKYITVSIINYNYISRNIMIIKYLSLIMIDWSVNSVYYELF